MKIAELIEQDRLTLAQLAKGIGAANAGTAQRYRDGDRIPDRARMQALVVFSEGRVTPNDVYGLTDLIEQLLARRARRLAKKRDPSIEPELPLEQAA